MYLSPCHRFTVSPKQPKFAYVERNGLTDSNDRIVALAEASDLRADDRTGACEPVPPISADLVGAALRLPRRVRRPGGPDSLLRPAWGSGQ